MLKMVHLTSRVYVCMKNWDRDGQIHPHMAVEIPTEQDRKTCPSVVPPRTRAVLTHGPWQLDPDLKKKGSTFILFGDVSDQKCLGHHDTVSFLFGDRFLLERPLTSRRSF